MDLAQEKLTTFDDEPNFLKKVITGDESWVYGYKIETKAQSSHWKCTEEPRPKKSLQVRSNVKVFLTVCFDFNSVVHHKLLIQGRTVNKEYYLKVMHFQKRSELWKNQPGIL